jgi:Gpi18-like mannosyltransferase
MSMLKNHKLKIALIIVLLLSVGLSLYSIWHYQGDSSSINPMRPIQQSFGQGGGGAAESRDIPRNGGGGSGGSQPSRGNPQGGDLVAPSQSMSTTPEGQPSNNNQSRASGSGGNRFGGAAAGASSQYANALVVYAVVFFGLSAAAYYRFVRRPIEIAEANKVLLIWMVLGAGLFLRIAAAPWIAGHPFDINLFKSWAASAANNLSGFYVNGSSDYPPFYVYVLYLVGKLAAVPAISSYFTLLVKLPSIVADVATAYLLYKVAYKYVSFEISLLIAVFYTFNPAVFINSTFWGQVDSFFTLIVVGAVLLLSQQRLGWSAALWTAAVLMKPQGIVYLPILFFELLRRKRVKPWFTAAGTALVTAGIIIIPFSLHREPLWLFKLYASTVNEYPYASVNAYNFFALLGANYRADSSTLFLFSYHTWGMAFIVLITLFSWWVYRKGSSARLTSLVALLQIAGVFTFSSSMHERYLFPALALALLAYAYCQDKRLLWLAAGFSAAIFINTYDIFYHATNGGSSYSITLVATSLLNVILCGFLVKVAWDLCLLKKS